MAAVDAALLEEDMEDLYENAPTGYLSTLPGGTIVKVNETLLAWTGYRREELVGERRLHDLLPPGARIYYETHYAPLLQMQGAIREIAVELLRADGGRLPVLLSSTLVRDDAGAPRIVRTTVLNASDRRRYEQELLRARSEAESRARAALALEHVDDGVLLVSTEGRVDVLNAAAESILGVPANAVGEPAAAVVPGWDAIAAHVPVANPDDRTKPTLIPVATGGQEQWLAVAAVETGDGVVYTLRDVTAERRLEQLRSDLVSVVSHELRTPLTGVYGSAQTLLARYDDLDDSTRRLLLEMIVGEGERLTAVVDRIILTGQLELGGAAGEAQAFDVAAVARDVREAIPEPTRTRVVVAADEPAQALGDAAATAQVVASLVDNALKYSAEAVEIRVDRGSPFVRLTVSDDGPGIPPGERERVFERFYRLDPGQQQGVGGTGLGLYIAKQLTERMNGRIGVLPGGGGTTVFVDLPAAD